MDSARTPLLFANKVIHKFVANLLAREITGRGVEAIRLVFRRCGGQWVRIVEGDPVHTGLLIRLVQAWGRSAKKVKPNEDETLEHVGARLGPGSR